MKLDDQPGYTVVEIMHKILAPESDPHKIRGMYIMGENPAMSDPDLNHARHALASLEHLVVQDIFMTETAWLADVVLPASAWPEKTGTVTNTDRMVQLGRQALDPPGDARPDLWIIQQMAARHGPGLALRRASTTAWPRSTRKCARPCTASIAGITWERLERESSVTYPCLSEDDPGAADRVHRPFRHRRRPRAAGAGRHHPGQRAARRRLSLRADHRPPARALAHRQHDAARRRARCAGADGHGLAERRRPARAGPGSRAMWSTVQSRRGEVAIHVRRDDGTPPGAVFIPFAYYEAAANLMTNAALDPFGKIPEFKYCAVAIRRGGVAAAVAGYRAPAASGG